MASDFKKLLKWFQNIVKLNILVCSQFVVIVSQLSKNKKKLRERLFDLITTICINKRFVYISS